MESSKKHIPTPAASLEKSAWNSWRVGWSKIICRWWANKHMTRGHHHRTSRRHTRRKNDWGARRRVNVHKPTWCSKSTSGRGEEEPAGWSTWCLKFYMFIHIEWYYSLLLLWTQWHIKHQSFFGTSSKKIFTNKTNTAKMTVKLRSVLPWGCNHTQPFCVVLPKNVMRLSKLLRFVRFIKLLPFNPTTITAINNFVKIKIKLKIVALKNKYAS